MPPVTDVAIVDQDWNFLNEGDHGEVVIKSPANMICYWNNPDATDEVLMMRVGLKPVTWVT